jgi:hypothetical protein
MIYPLKKGFLEGNMNPLTGGVYIFLTLYEGRELYLVELLPMPLNFEALLYHSDKDVSNALELFMLLSLSN